MLLSEFENLTSYKPSQEEWEAISIVYTWHPMIPDVKGKIVFAELFAKGSMGLVYDMLPAAERGAIWKQMFKRIAYMRLNS